MKHKALYDWYYKATTAQRQELIDLIEVPYNYLSMIANGKKPIGPEMAMRIEAATTKMHKKNPDLPIIKQPFICHVCSNCPYTKQ